MLKRPPANLSAKDFNKLTLCLNLTQSDNDNEALAAVRAANTILKRANLNWEAVWRDIESQMFERVAERLPTVPEALHDLLATMKPGSFRDLIQSFATRWATVGHLSDKQRKVLLDAWEGHNFHLRKKPPSN